MKFGTRQIYIKHPWRVLFWSVMKLLYFYKSRRSIKIFLHDIKYTLVIKIIRIQCSTAAINEIQKQLVSQ